MSIVSLIIAILKAASALFDVMKVKQAADADAELMEKKDRHHSVIEDLGK